MTNRGKSNFFGLFSALVIAATMPAVALAGTLTIHNKDCRTLTFHPWPKVNHRVTVHVYDHPSACTKEHVTVGKGHYKSVSLVPKHEIDGELYKCNYFHEAMGTAGGNDDVYGGVDSSVTCEEDWADVCQCTKD